MCSRTSMNVDSPTEPQSLSAADLFVFAGAGVSLSPPSCLPMFNWLRDDVLDQLGLADERGAPRRGQVAAGLAPEPFMSELRDGGIDLPRWLEETLGGEPNAAHRCLAALARDGARVWTVNFDTLIEQVDPGLQVLSWPEAPTRPAQLVKPHGTLGGQLIVASDQVLRGLDRPWIERLRSDVHGRLVVFVGYSGRDLDFQPIWDDVLEGSRGVVWFDQPSSANPAQVDDADRRRTLLRNVHARGALDLRPAGPPPPNVPVDARANSGADFVRWCVACGAADAEAADLAAMYGPIDSPIARLVGDRRWARAALLGVFGELDAARAARWHLLRFASTRHRAASELLRSEMTHGTVPGRGMLAVAAAIPPLTPSARVSRERANRQRVTALHRRARHHAVLRATRDLPADATSTLLLLRAASVRMTGSLDASADLAADALRRARREQHPVRAAHAAFQRAIALVWAERIDEARRCLDDELQPYATLASNRWVAWAAHVEAQIAIREGALDHAEARLQLAQQLFAAEALMDGVVSVRLVRLTLLRAIDSPDRFMAEHDTLAAPPDRAAGRWLWYSRRSSISRLAAELELAEFVRVHRQDRHMAHVLFQQAIGRWPLYNALAQLGIARTAPSRSERRGAAERAKSLAEDVDARLIARHAEAVIEQRRDADQPLLFC